MDDNTDNTKDIKSTQDFEMGDDKPQINNYQNQPEAPKTPENAPTQQQPQVDPTAAAPQAPQPEEKQTIGQAKIGGTPPGPLQGTPSSPLQPNIPPKKVSGPGRKKALLISAAIFGVLVLGLLIFSLITIVKSTTDTTHPLAQILGLSQAGFINGLITVVHIIFIIFALAIFAFTMIGLLKATMAKKEDKVARKAGIRKSMFWGLGLLVFLIIWLFVFVYLDGKRAQIEETLLNPIITDPEDTINLTAPIEIRFDASNVPVDSSKYQIISYDWNFGDGATGTSQIVTHKYETKGIFDVILEVTKLDRATSEQSVDKYSVIVSVQNQALTATFTADPQTGEAPLEVVFDAGESVDPDGNISRYEWDFDDDGDFDDAEGVTAEHEFERIGTYTVSLRVVSTTGEFDISEKEIVVAEQVGPHADITVVNEPQVFIRGTAYVFRAENETSENGEIVKYSWNFGDGTRVETTKTISHSFATAGTYIVTLTLTDEEGEEGEVTKNITVGAPQGTPNVKITTTPLGGSAGLEGTAPFTVTFDGSGSTDSDNNIVDYEWDFDGNGSADAFGDVVSHTFTEDGIYTVTLSVTDANDNVGKANVVVEVNPQGITAAVTADKIDGNVPLTVSFDASGSTYPGKQITSYRWDFDDGTAPKLEGSTIIHRFDSIGTYTVTVTALGSDNASDTAQILITVRAVPLSACFTSVFTEGSAPLNNTFDPSCTTGTVANYFWDFDDGGTSTAVKPTHTFTNPGTYTVTLEVTDADNTVSQTQKTITVTP